MAKMLKEFDFNAPKKTPLDQYLDGRIWQLKKGEDFDIAVTSQKGLIRKQARARGMEIQTHEDGDILIVQAYKPESVARTMLPSESLSHPTEGETSD